jgi:hypothetical protein
MFSSAGIQISYLITLIARFTAFYSNELILKDENSRKKALHYKVLLIVSTFWLTLTTFLIMLPNTKLRETPNDKFFLNLTPVFTIGFFLLLVIGY